MTHYPPFCKSFTNAEVEKDISKQASATKPTVPESNYTETKDVQFISEMQRRLEQYPISDQKYVAHVINNWNGGNRLIGYQGKDAYELACKYDYGQNPNKMAQSAYEANQYAIPLSQLEVFYKVEIGAVNTVGCN